MVVNISETTADCQKNVSDDYEADQSESQEVGDGEEWYENDNEGQVPFEGDGEEDLFSEDTNADVDLEGGSEETITNTTKSSEVVPSEEDAKDIDAENPKHVQGGSEETVTNTNTTQQEAPEVVPGEEKCVKPTDDPAVTETVTAPKRKTVISKKRKQRGKTCMVHGEIGGGGGDNGERKVTIVMHSDVKKILNTVKDKFYEYSKSVKNLDIKITTSPIISLEKAGDEFVTGEITHKVTVLPALTRDERKKIKICVDKKLEIERHMVDYFHGKSDSTLGKGLCEY